MAAILERNNNVIGRVRVLVLSDTGILIMLALARVLLQVFLNAQYGFHRDELSMIDASRDLAWGYVAYPPFTPFLGHLALGLFGPTLNGMRFFAVLAQGIGMLLAGLMVRDLGGGRWAQIVGAIAVGTAPSSIIEGGLFMYETFDFFCWVLVAYTVVRLLKTEDPRWWLGIGAAIGLGAMTKYTIVFWIAGLVVGVLLTRNRRYLLSPWLWAGVGLAGLIFLPNLVWQIQHHWISLDFLNTIHPRDVNIGRANSYLLDQIKFNASPILLFLIVSGLFYFFLARGGKRFRLLGWMYVVPFVLFILVKGLGYYLAPAYPMLVAGGAAWWDQRLNTLPAPAKRGWQRTTCSVLGISAVIAIALTLPIAPPGSAWWKVLASINGELKEEIGWPELVHTVADIYQQIPEADRPTTGILSANGGETGAINLYGPAYGLPKAISGFNSYWQNGYGDPPPQTVIVLGFGYDVRGAFETCKVAGRLSNAYNIPNMETVNNPYVYLCHNLQQPWPDFWAHFQYFG